VSESEDPHEQHPAHTDWSDRPIALAGFMGVGKSSIGRTLAGMLERPFVDSDNVIVERVGMSIAAMFRIGEEQRFRQTEADVIAELVAERPPKVIALGGGALGNPTTLAMLLEQALLIHIRLPWASLEPLIPKLRRGRPLLESSTVEEIHALFVSRDELYSACHLTVELRREGVRRSAGLLLDVLAPYGIKATSRSDSSRPARVAASGEQ
jgi:shikimate kinase